MMSVVFRIIQLGMMFMGAIIALVGLGLDLFFNHYPGFNHSQIIIVVAGIGLSITGYLFHRFEARVIRNLSQDFWKKVLLVLISVISSLIFLEVGLALMGYKPYYQGDEATEVTLESICDEMGCRFNPNRPQSDDCAGRQETERSCIINGQGFADRDEFVQSEALEAASFRIIALGDSFTYGNSADMGHSWAELIETEVDGVVVWNLGIQATGTAQALASLQHFLPIMKPDLVILGFYVGNDFEDNLFPLGNYAKVYAKPYVKQYRLDNNLNPIRLTDREIAFNSRQLEAPANGVDYLIRRTRVGSILARTFDNISANFKYDPTIADEIPVTEKLLSDLRDYAQANDTPLLILLVPAKPSVYSNASELRETAQQLFQTLSIPFIDPSDQLDMIADYKTAPDDHWNNTGHAKAAALLIDCITRMMEGEAVQTCTSD